MTTIEAAQQRFTPHSDLGTFEGFNFRDQTAIWPNVSAEDVINWDHDKCGEAEFWPSGDCAEIALLFGRRSAVTGLELVALDELLQQMGDDSIQNWLRIHYVLNVLGEDIARLTVEMIEDPCLHIFQGTSFIDLRRDAAFELFELFYPEEYQVWEKSHCDGLDFDTDRFLDSPSWSVEEVAIDDSKFLIISAQ